MKQVLVISGPTGSGESTITKEIIKKYPKFSRLVTATSRAPRNNEKDKIDYYFFSKEVFEDGIENGNIVEFTFIENRGVYYGTYKPDLENKIRKGLNVIVNVDIVGTKYYKENYSATTIFIHPGTIENLRLRLSKRDKNISKTELEKRIKNAEKEIKEEMPHYDYVVINEEGKLEKAIGKVLEILRKEGYQSAL
jgi:guanylate kinase